MWDQSASRVSLQTPHTCRARSTAVSHKRHHVGLVEEHVRGVPKRPVVLNPVQPVHLARASRDKQAAARLGHHHAQQVQHRQLRRLWKRSAPCTCVRPVPHPRAVGPHDGVLQRQLALIHAHSNGRGQQALGHAPACSLSAST